MRGAKARRIRRLNTELARLRADDAPIERRRELRDEIARVKAKGAPLRA